jgi:3-oxoacyl-[acyl-carrier protein] reductase
VNDQAGSRPATSGDGPLLGKTAIVTGAARNIGRATALALAADGAAVVVNALRDQQAARRVAEEIEGAGGRAIAHLADVTDREAVEEMVRIAERAFGSIDILVCNASQRGMKPFLSMSYEEWRRVVDISLDGTFHLAQVCVPHMLRASWGRIVTLGGMSWYVGTPERVHSLVSKSGLVGLTRGLAAELAPHGITVNCVAPGSIDTARPASAGPRPPMKTSIPVGRMGEPRDVADVVRFLCQPEAAYITGQTVHVNGGSYLGG